MLWVRVLRRFLLSRKPRQIPDRKPSEARCRAPQPCFCRNLECFASFPPLLLTSSSDSQRRSLSPGRRRARGEWKGGEAIAATAWRREQTIPCQHDPDRGKRSAEEDLRVQGTAGLLQRGAGRRRVRCMQRAGSSGARGECDISGARRLRLEQAACLGRAVHTSPGGGRGARQAAGMSAKERPKGKVIKDSVTLLPCFYFVEVSWPRALA